jgi:glutamine amidotransferase
MGWNGLVAARPSALLDGLEGEDVYFAHSYAAEPLDDVAIALVEHDGPLVAVVESGPVAGVQFHPERSGGAGARFLANVLRWSRSA